MTFLLDAQREKPVAIFMMDDTTPLQDYSPFARTATTSGGTPTQHSALCKGAAWAPVFTNTVVANYANTPVFIQNFETNSFSLECWLRVVNTTSSGDQKVLSHTDAYDGLVINGTVVKFITKYTTAPDSICSFDLQSSHAAHVVGIHSETKNSLYVNGVLVDEDPLSDVQQADTFLSSATGMISGTTAASQSIALNGVSMYSSALSGDVILRHFNMGRDLPQVNDVIASYAGDYFQVSVPNMDIFLDQTISTLDDWNLGFFDNAAVIKETLVPTFDDSGTSVAGSWHKSIVLDITGVTSIYGVQFDWDGNGATVAVSLDGTTWENVTRGINCTTITPATDPTDKVLQIRVSFPGSILSDTSYVDNLSIVGFVSSTTLTMAGRNAVMTSAHPEREHQFTEYSDQQGMEIQSGGTLVISADTLDSTVARTLEVLVCRKGTNPTFSMSGTAYNNGVSGSTTLVDGQWTLLHIVAGSDVSGTITITGPCQIGYVGIYPVALTSTQVASIYAQYVGTDAPLLSDSAIISMTELTNASKIYSQDWAITASG